MLNELTKPQTASKKARALPEVTLARTEDDLYQAFRLVYLTYYEAGLSVDNPSGLRLTPYHLLPDSDVIICKIRDEIFSTMSLFGDGELGLPMQSMYADEVDEMRQQGIRLAEVGSLADRRHSSVRFIHTFASMSRLLGQVAMARGYQALVAAVHPKHARLYKRVLGFKQIGNYTECPYANGNPAVAVYLRFDDMSEELYNQYFGNPLSAGLLAPQRWSYSTRKHFRRILDCDGKISKTVGLNGFYDWSGDSATLPVS